MDFSQKCSSEDPKKLEIFNSRIKNDIEKKQQRKSRGLKWSHTSVKGLVKTSIFNVEVSVTIGVKLIGVKINECLYSVDLVGNDCL